MVEAGGEMCDGIKGKMRVKRRSQFLEERRQLIEREGGRF